jgi:hypothetical protein
LSQRRLTQREIRFLQEVLSADYKIVNIRLREGEYQYNLAESIASFQLELCFPDVKDITKRLYGEEKAKDTQFIRKIQTILKKMQKSNVVRIMKKEKPWELQRYALSSFKFQDVDKNVIVLATDEQMKRIQDLIHSSLSREEEEHGAKLGGIKSKISVLVFVIVASYAAILWDLTQLTINPIIFVSAFSIVVACSLMLGKILSQE